MKLPTVKSLGHFSTSEIIVLIVFIIYILFPIQTPHSVRPFIHGLFGLILIIVGIGALFLFTNPILGILGVFVAYELLRRSAFVNFMNTPDVSKQGVNSDAEPASPSVNANHKPFEVEIPSAPEAPNSFAYRSLEEEMIDAKAPVGKSSIGNQFLETSFQPVAEKIDGASLYA